MGLDAVELVMEVEDHFGITLAEADWVSLRTVGDMVALIEGRLQMARESPCLALPFFLKVRRTVREVTGDERLRIRPGDSVVQYLSARQRRLLWKRLPSVVHCQPHDLPYPLWAQRMLLALAAALLVTALLLGLWIDLLILPLTFAVAIAVSVALVWLTGPFRTDPPYGWMTFGEITLSLVGSVATTKQSDLRTTDEILAELRPVIAETLGVDQAKVVLSTRFVEDLGVG